MLKLATKKKTADQQEITDQETRKKKEKEEKSQRANRRRADDAERSADQRVQTSLALRAVIGHVTLTRSDVIAWFVLKPVSTSFRNDTEIESVINAGAASLARLGAVRTYWRTTTRPLSVREWAERTYRDAAAHGSPLPGFADMLEREQRRMQQCAFTSKLAFVGVRVASRRRHPLDPRREVQGLQGRLAEVADHMAGTGLEAKPARPEQMEFLLRRSVALGMPSPRLDRIVSGDWERADLPQLEQMASVTAEPFARTAQVRHITDQGEDLTRHVAVLTLGRVGAMDIPQDRQGGWMQRVDRLNIPAEWMATVDVLDEQAARAALRHQMDVIQDQWEHYTSEHKIAPPELLKQQHSQALESERELDAGLAGESTRTHGWFRLAVWGDTHEETMRRVAMVQKLYGQRAEWWHSGGQIKLVKEFIPGEPLANTAQRRRFVLPSLMAGLPAAASAMGDGYGAAFGATSGTSRSFVSWDLWRDMEVRDRSGLAMLLGGLGSGKSFLAGGLVYRTAMAGVSWSVLDPSGRLGTLCEIPELSDHARYYDLTRGEGGELSPYRSVADPQRDFYPDTAQGEADWKRDFQDARKTRQQLARDALTSCLPQNLRKNQHVTSVMGRTVRAVSADVTTPAAELLDQIKQIADGNTETDLTQEHRIAARDVWNELSDFAESNRGNLIFGEAAQARSSYLLEVYSLAGLQMPSSDVLAAGEEDTDVRRAIALFSLAAWKVQTRTFAADPNQRKGLLIDEGHLLNQLPSGPALIQKSAVDSRKHDLRAIFASQNATHFDLKSMSNLIGLAMVGKTTDTQEGGAGEAALDVLGRPHEQRHLTTLASLSPDADRDEDDSDTTTSDAATGDETKNDGGDGGSTKPPQFREFVIAAKDETGVTSRIERTVFDLYAHPHVVRALNSTPGGHETQEA